MKDNKKVIVPITKFFVNIGSKIKGIGKIKVQKYGKDIIAIIDQFTAENNLNHCFNVFGGYKLLYNNMEIDFFPGNDFAESCKYNIDGAAYDIKNREFLILGQLNSLQSRKILTLKNSKNVSELYIDIETD